MATNNDPTELPCPLYRPLRVFAFDPSHGRLLGNEMQLDVQYREVAPGPAETGRTRNEIAVIDYDAGRKKYYRPIDLDDTRVLARSGLSPTQSDPRFHQQMVYAVVRETIEQFENALGRRIHWRRAERAPDAPRGWQEEDILTLQLFPHAMQDANAFYSPDAHGILFGYFQANPENSGHNLPGQLVFTCLSHDIIVHETTHAILDGMRSHFMEQTNPDVAAFHEAFADLAALFRHFSHREFLLDAIRRTGGRLYSAALQHDPLADRASLSWLAAGDEERNPLIELATQFGEATGMNSGLRSAIGKPKTMGELRDTAECHERGSILVAAVFDAFFTIYLMRASRVFNLYGAAGGVEREDLPAPVADALCEEASRTAMDFFRTCVTALDYLPPVDVTFGDFLRAAMTAQRDFDAVDAEGVRNAWMQAFRRRQILPDDASDFSDRSLCWAEHDDSVVVRGLLFGGPLGLTYDERGQAAAALRAFIDQPQNRQLLELDPKLDYVMPSFHPLYRADRDGRIRWDMVVEVVQTDRSGPTERRAGTTIIVSSHSTGSDGDEEAVFVRYVISKPLTGARGERRRQTQDDYLRDQGVRPGTSLADLRINFALVHGGE